MTYRTPSRLLPALPVLLLLGGCVVEPANPYPAIPAAQVESVPPPPAGRAVVWQPGNWHWNGTQYVWRPGHYVERVAAVGRWVPGHWARAYGQWQWVPGHWA